MSSWSEATVTTATQKKNYAINHFLYSKFSDGINDYILWHMHEKAIFIQLSSNASSSSSSIIRQECTIDTRTIGLSPKLLNWFVEQSAMNVHGSRFETQNFDILNAFFWF